MPLEILSGLSVYGAPAIAFSPDSTQHHAEGLVVDFDGAWTGNFAKGKTDHSAPWSQFAPDHVHVISGGNHYVVDVKRRSAASLTRVWVGASIFTDTTNFLIVFNLTHGTAYQGRRAVWESEQIAWDGIRSVSESAGEVHGEAFDPHANAWARFTLDATTGRLAGGTLPVRSANGVKEAWRLT